MCRFFRGLLGALLLILGSSSVASPSAYAQFVQTDISTYQLPDPKQEVAVIMTAKGIFVSHSPRRSSTLSGFDPEQLTSENSTSLFLAYAPDSKVPERLFLPGPGNLFRIRGTFTVALSEHVRVAIALNTNGLPYVTIVSAEKGHEAILGFVGQQPVVNLSGLNAVELLEADPLRRQYGAVAAPYLLRSDNRLSLLDKLVPPGTSIGLLSPPDNPCLSTEAVFRSEETQADVEKKKKPQRLEPSAFLFLNISSKLIVGIHYDSGRFVSIEQESPEGKVCVVRQLQLRKG